MREKSRHDKVGRLRQLHLWLDRPDYVFVKSLAHERDVSVSRLFRRLIKGWRTQAAARSGTNKVPNVADRVRINEAGDPPQGTRGDATQTNRSSRR